MSKIIIVIQCLKLYIITNAIRNNLSKNELFLKLNVKPESGTIFFETFIKYVEA